MLNVCNRKQMTRMLVSHRFKLGKRLKATQSLAQSPEKQFKSFPTAKPPDSKLLAMTLGNFADLRPWDRSEALGLKMIKKKYDWYKSVGENEKTVLVDLAGRKFLYTSDLYLIRELTAKHSNKFAAFKEVTTAWQHVMPTGLLFTQGELWHRLRGIYKKAINRLDNDKFSGKIYSVCKDAEKYYFPNKSQVVKISDLLSRLTFDAFNQIAFDKNLCVLSGKDDQILRDCVFMANVQADRMVTPVSVQFIRYLYLAEYLKFRAARSRVYKFVDDLIDKEEHRYKARVESGEIIPHKTRASNLLEAFTFSCFEPDETEREGINTSRAKPALSKNVLRDQVLMSLFAGFETTHSTMALCLRLLAKHPEIQDRLHDEVKDVDFSTASADDLNKLKLLNNSINEANRLGANFPEIPRQVIEDIEIDDYFIPKGYHVMYDIDVLGRSPEIWKANSKEELDRFDPDRWVDQRPPKGAFNPFGIGPRACIGKKIAVAQLQAAIGFMMQNYKLRETDKPVELTYLVGRSVKRDSELRFIRR